MGDVWLVFLLVALLPSARHSEILAPVIITKYDTSNTNYTTENGSTQNNSIEYNSTTNYSSANISTKECNSTTCEPILVKDTEDISWSPKIIYRIHSWLVRKWANKLLKMEANESSTTEELRYKQALSNSISPFRVDSTGKRSKTPKTSSKVLLTKDLYEGGHTTVHAQRCPNLGANIRVLILVATALSHRVNRDAIRMTWGHHALRSDVAMAFVIGNPTPYERKYNWRMIKALKEEDAIYGDLIVGKFIDCYANLTLKTISMLEWADTHCPLARMMLKVDDDVFIDVPNLLYFIHSVRHVNNTIFGQLYINKPVIRSRMDKNYVTYKEYPRFTYPDYMSGGASYLLTRDVIRPLLLASADRPYFKTEDVFLTGFVAKSIGVRLRNWKPLKNRKIQNDKAPSWVTDELTPCKLFEVWRARAIPKCNKQICLSFSRLYPWLEA